jgi:hypothetical protein
MTLGWDEAHSPELIVKNTTFLMKEKTFGGKHED